MTPFELQGERDILALQFHDTGYSGNCYSSFRD